MSEVTAYHEAGHVLVALLLGARVKQVTIAPDDDDGPRRFGDTQIVWRRSRLTDQQLAENAVRVSLAGPAAEMIYTGDPFHPGMVAEWSADWQLAWEAAALLHADERKRLDYLEQVSIRIYHRLNRDELWSVLAALADELLAHETLDREQIEELASELLGDRA